jgi:uracil-DNA glycosylase family 4
VIPRLVQSGPRTAKIVAVGEAPGATEDQTGIPFSGASGEDLNRYLADVDIPRSEVFVTNVVHERPPRNKFEAFLKPKPALALLQGIVQLKKDIDEIKPNLVVALGDVPLRFLTNKHSITKWRGSILESTLCKGQKVIATYHPASVFRMYPNKALIRLDMKRIAEEAKFPEIILPEREIIIWGDNVEGSMLGYTQLVAEDMFNAEWLSVDIETDEDYNIICVGFSDSPHRALVVPLSSPGADQAIRRLLQSPARKCGQNFGQFDLTVLEDRGYEVANFAWDIMYSHHALLLEAAAGGDEVKMLRGGKTEAKSPLAKGLGFQVSIYTKEPFYKDDGKLWRMKGANIQEFWRYNGKDAACTHEIRGVHDVELDKMGVRHVFEHEMKVMWLVRKMTRRGVKIDLDARKSLNDQYEKEIENLQSFLDKSVGGMPNVKSSKQMCDLLYNKLGLPVQYRVVDNVKTDRPTADKNAILKLAAEHPHPVLMAILEIRKRRDLIERYLNATVDADGRMRCLFDPSGTRTARLASRANIYGSGTNLQNIPPKLRRMFVADPGQVFFYVDLSQAEARVVAYLARCEALIELFSSGRDIHKENAVRFFGQYDEEKRVAVKRIVHGSNYGEGVDKIIKVAAADGIKLMRLEVQKGQEAYFMLYPEIKEIWWNDVREALKYRVLTTPLGWKRQFYGRWDSVQFFNEALAFVPQCTVGVLGEMGMLAAAQVEGADILLNEHDAVLGQCDETKAEEVVARVQKAMEIPIEIHGRTLIIPSDAKVGKNWGEFNEKTGENPEGLRKWKLELH